MLIDELIESKNCSLGLRHRVAFDLIDDDDAAAAIADVAIDWLYLFIFGAFFSVHSSSFLLFQLLVLNMIALIMTLAQSYALSFAAILIGFTFAASSTNANRSTQIMQSH